MTDDQLDAKRYRWLRRQSENLMACFSDSQFGLADYLDGLSREELDRAIDAEMAKEEPASPSPAASAQALDGSGARDDQL